MRGRKRKKGNTKYFPLTIGSARNVSTQFVFGIISHPLLLLFQKSRTEKKKRKQKIFPTHNWVCEKCIHPIHLRNHFTPIAHALSNVKDRKEKKCGANIFPTHNWVCEKCIHPIRLRNHFSPIAHALSNIKDRKEKKCKTKIFCHYPLTIEGVYENCVHPVGCGSRRLLQL